MKLYKIKYINYGIANVINTTIEFNKRLKKHPKLFNRILKHELEHIRGVKYADFKQKFDKELWWFILTNPTAWVQFLPVWLRGNTIVYNRTMLYLWSTILYVFTAVIIGFSFPKAALWLAVSLAPVTLLLSKWIL